MVSLALVGCSHDVTSPSVTLSSVAPDLVCNGPSVSRSGGATNVALSGSDFTPMPSQTLADPRRLLLPNVTLAPVAALPGGVLPAEPIDVADDPANPDASRVHWASESAMSFDVAPGDALPSGVFDVTVTNPDGKHASTLDQVLAIVPPPIVTAAQPRAISGGQTDRTIVVTGASFVVYDGATPEITITSPAGTEAYTSTSSASDCAPIPGSFTEHGVELCSAISFVVPDGDIVVTANTLVELVVTSPAPADCASRLTFVVPMGPATRGGTLPTESR